jgi:ADP-heptose:LPS heptosyltransferase
MSRKVFLLNLTRLGDLLQTSPTIAGLVAQEAGTEVTVCADRNFAPVCRGLPGVARIVEMDLDRLGRRLLAGTAADLRAAYADVESTVAALRAERFDLALNFSSSRMSAVLMGLLGVPDTRGWTMTADGHRQISHPWSRLFAASALHRQTAAFNLVDCYRRVAGIRGGPGRLAFAVPDAARARAATLLPAGDGPWIALQLGASRAARRWPAASFVALARRLRERLGARIVLVGGPGERALAAEVAAGAGAVVDLCGRTDVAELGAVLERAALLVTTDTGPMHMAVAVGTPVVALFFGPALPVDTGPYGADHVCLHAAVACAPCEHSVTCLEPFCRDVIAPDAVADAVAARHAGDWSALAAAATRWPAIRWYRTGFDAEGLFDLVPLGSPPADAAAAIRRAYRALWKAALDGTPPAGATAAAPEAAAAARGVAALAADGVRLARALERLARRPPDATAVARLERGARALEAVDAALARQAAIHAAVAPLVQMFRFEKETLGDADVGALATATRRLHSTLEERATLLATLLAPAAGASPDRDGRLHARVA